MIGQLLANIVTDITQSYSSHWAYSGPFASQWLWCLIIFIGYYWAPESPWWLVRHGRDADAEEALRRLTSTNGGIDIKQTLATIKETDRLEQELEAGSRYADCFRKINLHRTEISIGVYSIQVISGVYLITYVTYFFELAGLADSKAFDMGVGFLVVGFCSTIMSWYLMTRFGRRYIPRVLPPFSD